jgi:tetratricopeptide (TPR) repeat protein
VETIGKYEILRKIGGGGFGVVYQGRDPFLKRAVAIKTLTVDLPELRDRFFREAEVAGRLQHPSITAVFDFGFAGNTPYLVQEYLEGEDLDAVIARRPAVPLRQRVEWLIQLARGLEYAHANGVVHRDIKPSNMRLLDGQRLKIMDFGIAKLKGAASQLTRTGTTLGTAAYLPPEQLRGEPVDQRADLFSFGATAYEVLAYRRAFDATSVHHLFYQLIREEPPPLTEWVPDCPPVLAAAVHRCLAKQANDRYPSASELLVDLVAARDELLARERRTGAEVRGDSTAPPPEGSAPRGATPSSAANRSLVERLRLEAQSLIARDALEEARTALRSALELAPGDPELQASLAAVEGELDRRRASGGHRDALAHALREVGAALDRGDEPAAAELLAEARLLYGDDREELAALGNRLATLRRERRALAPPAAVPPPPGIPSSAEAAEAQVASAETALAAGELRGAAAALAQLEQLAPQHPAIPGLRAGVAQRVAQLQRAAGARDGEGTVGGLSSLPGSHERQLAAVEHHLSQLGERLAALPLPVVLGGAGLLFLVIAVLLLVLLL